MFKLIGKIVKKNNTLNYHTYEASKDGQTHEALLRGAIEDICNRFDISNPIWLSDNTLDMARGNKTRFKAHHFIEDIEFDYFEIEYLPENPDDIHIY
ncbi:MAG: hypothetical protein LCH34_10345 [Firmicutes bacterium]|nr:hypothetical protein [Bacillota bacterium]